MTTPPYWIDDPWPYSGRIAISARPRGGDWLDDELAGWRDILGTGGVVVSLLTPDEEEDLGLEREERSSVENGLQFVSLPIVDRNVPVSDPDAVRLIEDIVVDLRHGHNVLVHCRQGVGRSGMIAAGVLIKSGSTPDEAMRRWTAIRNVQVPETTQQRNWLTDLPARFLDAKTHLRSV